MLSADANPRKRGDAGVGVAISWFTRNGYTVCIPLTDTQGFDLVVEKDGSLYKVFVRTTTYRESSGNFYCGLRVISSNMYKTKIKKFDNSSVDIVFIVCEDLTSYLIPAKDISIASGITLGPKYAKYIV